MIEVLLAAAAVAVAVAIQLASGSGFGLLAAPLLLLVEPNAVPVPLLLVTVPMMLVAAWQDRAGLAGGFDLGSVVVVAVPAAVVAAALAPAALAPAVVLMLGILEVVVAAAALAGWRLPETPMVAPAAGLASGTLAALVATPGLPVLMVYRNANPVGYRANLAVYYLVVTVASIGLILGLRGIGTDALVAAARLLPGVLAGWPLGAWLGRRMRARQLRPVGLILAAVAGAALIVKASAHL
ncbi:TSUP family transporter [Micropruina sp.]|uniref:TSUP family transporter n=1 Tax=Micropruina sp. TaxID=2737536 RepID=UPI00260AEF3C|nr:TSUP family transporter [Micropruina sp.]